MKAGIADKVLGPDTVQLRTEIAITRDWRSAFTIVELLVIIATLTFLFAIVLPRLVRTKARATQERCASNLKQVGLGFLSWAHDSESDRFPFKTSIAEKGNMVPFGVGDASPFVQPSLERNKPYWQFAFISNQLNSPKVLVCPADRNVGARRKLAMSFGSDASLSGLMAPGFRDEACSLTIALEGRIFYSGPATLERTTPAILSTDRNIRWNGRNTNCSTGVGEAEEITGRDIWLRGTPANTPWTNAIHGQRGNVLTIDGAVEECNSMQLDILADNALDKESTHFLVPR